MPYFESINKRIEHLVAVLSGGNKSAFAQKIGASEANIRNYINGVEPKAAVLERIVIYFDISADWLLTGEGEILKTKGQERAGNPDGGIPLIPLDVVAGFCSGNTAQVTEYGCERYVVPGLEGAEFLIPVKGSSMYPKYSSGDMVACKGLPPDTFFQWNKVYVVDTEQGVLIKRIRRGLDDEHVLMVSENEKYEPFSLHRSEIRALAIVIGVIHIE